MTRKETSEDYDVDDRGGALLRLLGIERWLVRPAQVSGRAARATEAGEAGEVGQRPRRASIVADARPVSRQALPRQAYEQSSGDGGQTPSPVSTDPNTDRWRLQLDVHVCADVLAVLEDTVVVPQRFVRDLCAAIAAIGGKYEPLQPLEDFSWPPGGRMDLAVRGPCRAAFLAMLLRLWQERRLTAIVLYGPRLLELCSDAASAPAAIGPPSAPAGGVVAEVQSDMRLLYITNPNDLVESAEGKRGLWSLIQRGLV